jgi:hypothetical protein
VLGRAENLARARQALYHRATPFPRPPHTLLHPSSQTCVFHGTHVGWGLEAGSLKFAPPPNWEHPSPAAAGDGLEMLRPFLRPLSWKTGAGGVCEVGSGDESHCPGATPFSLPGGTARVWSSRDLRVCGHVDAQTHPHPRTLFPGFKRKKRIVKSLVIGAASPAAGPRTRALLPGQPSLQTSRAPRRRGWGPACVPSGIPGLPGCGERLASAAGLSEVRSLAAAGGRQPGSGSPAPPAGEAGSTCYISEDASSVCLPVR